ncbi:MAG: hypothetical protein ACI835_005285 [Planctomycetota bacterium]
MLVKRQEANGRPSSFDHPYLYDLNVSYVLDDCLLISKAGWKCPKV